MAGVIGCASTPARGVDKEVVLAKNGSCVRSSGLAVTLWESGCSPSRDALIALSIDSSPCRLPLRPEEFKVLEEEAAEIEGLLLAVGFRLVEELRAIVPILSKAFFTLLTGPDFMKRSITVMGTTDALISSSDTSIFCSCPWRVGSVSSSHRRESLMSARSQG